MYDDEPSPDGQRLARLLARRGVASRREAERMIAEGRVTVNGQVPEGPAFVDLDRDAIRIDGKRIPREPPRGYFVIYKPRGTITSRNDPKGRKSVLDLAQNLPCRVETVGRLDYDTEGALLLTNDGDLAHRLLHPSRKVPKRYLVKCYRRPSDKDLEAIRTGVYLEDGKTAPALARIVETTREGANAWVEVTITEGRNRLIRRMFAKLGHPVSKLRRESFATISIRGLERGQVRALTRNEVQRLQEIAAGMSPRKAGRKRGKGFAKAKPKPRRPNHRKKRA